MTVLPISDNAIELIPSSEIEDYYMNRFLGLLTIGKGEIRIRAQGKIVTVTSGGLLMKFPMLK